MRINKDFLFSIEIFVNFDLGEIGKLSEEDLMSYEASLKHKRDTESVLNTVRRSGRAEGIREGERKKAIESARKMLLKGYSKEEICDILNLSIEDIEKL